MQYHVKGSRMKTFYINLLSRLNIANENSGAR
jgi:hypothetical protein